MTSPVQAGSSPVHPVSQRLGVTHFAPEIGGALLFIAAGAFAWRFWNQLPLPTQILLGVLLLVALALVFRRVLLSLFGPVLFYDALRLSRRGRYILLRCLYAGALLVFLSWQYSEWTTDWQRLRFRKPLTPFPGAGQYVPAQSAQVYANALAAFAERFFNLFMVVQFALVYCLAPVYAATCITEEKDRKTIEYLLATDLSSREIVISKLLSRLGNLCMIVLTGLPIVGLLQFLGGVDPDLVVAGFAATAITMLSLTSLGVLCSLYARTSRDAILLSYLCLIGYLGVGYLLQQVAALPSAKTPLAPGMSNFTLSDMVKGINAGNLLFVLADLQNAWAKGTPLSSLVSAALRSYVLFHALVAFLFVFWAVLRFRAAGMRQRVIAQARAARARLRPRMARRPMVWKEVFVEPGFRLSRTGRVVVGIFVMVSFVPPIWSTHELWLRMDLDWGRSAAIWAALEQALGPWIRATGTILGGLMLVAVAVRASTSITGERDRETLDGLLTTPLQSHDILFAKWLGSLLSVRWAWLWIGAIWLIGLATRAIHPLVIPLFVIAWLVYASALAGVGLWFSTACRTSVRAILCTLTTTVVLCGGQYVLSLCCLPCMPFFSLDGEFSGILTGFTPVSVFYEIAATRQQVASDAWQLWVIMVYVGLFMWALAALSLWTFTRSRFRRITARMPYRRLQGRRAMLYDAWGQFDEREAWQEVLVPKQ